LPKYNHFKPNVDERDKIDEKDDPSKQICPMEKLDMVIQKDVTQVDNLVQVFVVVDVHLWHLVFWLKPVP